MRRILVLLFLVAGVAPGQDRLASAERLLKNGHYEKALAQLEKLEPEQAREPRVWRTLAEVHRGLGRHQDVAHQAGRYLEKHAGDVEVLIWLGEAFFALGQDPDLRPSQAEGYREQALDVAEEILGKEAGRLEAMRLKVCCLIALERKDEAVKTARAMSASYPDRPYVQYLLAMAFDASAQPGEAIGVLRGLGAKHPQQAWIHRERGLIHLRMSQTEEAFEAFNKALAAKELDDDTRRIGSDQVWNLCAQYKDWKRAKAMVDGWLSVHKKDPLGLWWRGYMLELQAEPAQAAKVYLQAWKLSKRTLGEAALHLAHLLYDQKKVQQALPYLGHAIRLGARARPGTWTAEDRLILIAREHVGRGKFQKAAKLLDEYGVRHGTDHFTLLQNLGFILREWGSSEAAKKRVGKARKLWQRSADLYVKAADLVLASEAPARSKAQILNDTGLMFHYHLGRTDDGIRYYRHALELDPLYLDALENMGVVAYERKEWQAAIEWFDKVLKLANNRFKAKRMRTQAQEQLSKS